MLTRIMGLNGKAQSKLPPRIVKGFAGVGFSLTSFSLDKSTAKIGEVAHGPIQNTHLKANNSFPPALVLENRLQLNVIFIKQRVK